MEVIVNRVYRHFKGDFYIVEGFAINCETLEKMVIYKSLYGNGETYVRNYTDFISFVDKNKYPDVSQKYRFELQDIKSIR